jgi:hypothetical protein
MAYELSFSPEFFIGPYDLDGSEFDQDRPTSVYQAIMAMSDEAFEEMAREVFNCEPDFVDVSMVLDKIRETNTCRNLTVPVEVLIDEDGYFSVEVYNDTE